MPLYARAAITGQDVEDIRAMELENKFAGRPDLTPEQIFKEIPQFDAMERVPVLRIWKQPHCCVTELCISPENT